MRTALALAVLLASALPARAAVDAHALWSKKCQGCHGADGKGETTMGRKHKVKDLTSAEWQQKNSDAKIREAIANGVPDTKMKAYKGTLSDEEIDALVGYVRSLKK